MESYFWEIVSKKDKRRTIAGDNGSKSGEVEWQTKIEYKFCLIFFLVAEILDRHGTTPWGKPTINTAGLFRQYRYMHSDLAKMQHSLKSHAKQECYCK